MRTLTDYVQLSPDVQTRFFGWVVNGPVSGYKIMEHLLSAHSEEKIWKARGGFGIFQSLVWAIFADGEESIDPISFIAPMVAQVAYSDAQTFVLLELHFYRERSMLNVIEQSLKAWAVHGEDEEARPALKRYYAAVVKRWDWVIRSYNKMAHLCFFPVAQEPCELVAGGPTMLRNSMGAKRDAMIVDEGNLISTNFNSDMTLASQWEDVKRELFQQYLSRPMGLSRADYNPQTLYYIYHFRYIQRHRPTLTAYDCLKCLDQIWEDKSTLTAEDFGLITDIPLPAGGDGTEVDWGNAEFDERARAAEIGEADPNLRSSWTFRSGYGM